MPRPNRRDIVDPDEVGIYHCYSRCARGAYLCGFDRETNMDYGHRKGWIIDRQNLLARIFALELFAYAVLDNHMHHVIRTRPDVAKQWTDEEVIRRWHTLHPQKSENGAVIELTDDHLAALLKDKAKIEEWRRRLASLSWYMKELKENIAKRANRESGKTGHFFDARFNSPRIADALTLLLCLLYVELNPVRAAIVDRPEAYKHCSFQLRCLAHLLRQKCSDNNDNQRQIAPDASLQPIPETGEQGNLAAPTYRPSDEGILPMSAAHFLTLVDWVGRSKRPDKRGTIPSNLAPVLERLGGTSELLADSQVLYGHLFRRAGRRVHVRVDKFTSEVSAA